MAQEVAPIRLTGLRGYLKLGLEREDNERDNFGRELDEEDNSYFEEVGLDVNGYVYHPRLIDFSMDSAFLFEQESTSGDLQPQEDLKGRYIDYDLYLKILKKHPVSLFLSTTKNTSDINASFFESQKVTFTRKEAMLRYRNKLFPTEFGYNTSSSKGEGLNREDSEIDTLFLNVDNLGKMGTSNLRAEHEEKIQTVGNIDLRKNKVLFSNSLPFGHQEKHRLSSRYRWDEQTGTLRIRTVSMSESLYLRHTDTLNTVYDYVYNDQKLIEQETTSYRYRAGLQHSLYQSLSTNLDFNQERFQINSGTEDTVSGQLDINYRKKIPFGVLGLRSVSLLMNEDEDLSGENVIQVPREVHVFQGNPEGDEVILLNREVVKEDTITFEDASELPIIGFDEGIDYRVETTGTFTRIRLLPGRDGPIDIGDTVWVNYDVEPQPPVEFETRKQVYRADLNIKSMWKIFYQKGRSDQILKRGIDLNRLEDTKESYYGTELLWKNTTTTMERRKFQSRRNPVEREIYSETIRFPFRSGALLTLKGTYSEVTTFKDVDKTFDRLASVHWVSPFGQQGKWSLEALYRNQDLLEDAVKDVELNMDLLWGYRAIDVVLSYESLRRRQETTGKELRQRIFLQVRKYFGARR